MTPMAMAYAMNWKFWVVQTMHLAITIQALPTTTEVATTPFLGMIVREIACSTSTVMGYAINGR